MKIICNGELYHYGIKGQKWGIRRYQNKDGSLTDAGRNHKYANKNMSNAETQNLDRWGTDKKHNILYISGRSGSGKSTVALSMADSKTNVIHLDSYFELRNLSEAKQNQNRNFNLFLKKNGFDSSSLNNKKLFKSDIKSYFKKVDEFTKLTELFAEEEYGKTSKVIMEGVQLLDETMYPNKNFFNDKPCILLKTNDNVSQKRAAKRDSNH